MRYSQEHKAETRRRILDAAARVFRQNGYHASGVDAVMAEAGLTAGAFYGHFESKEALFAECMAGLFEDQRERRENGLDGLQGRSWVEGLITNYLSDEHFDHPAEGCPLPSLTPEVSRASDDMRAGFQRQLGVWSRELEAALELEFGETLEPEARRAVALGTIAAMVGGMTLARAMPDRERALRILDGARRMALAALRNGIETHVEGLERGECCPAPERDPN